MPEAAIRANFHQPLDIEGHFLAQIAFHAVLLFNDFADLVGLVIVQVADLRRNIHAR